jgi:uncharacterized protein
MVTTWPCFTETMHLLGRYGGWAAQQELWSYVLDDSLILHLNSPTEHARMATLMAQYRDIPMDLGDASLVVTAEVLKQSRIFTLDRDFQIYRLHGSQPFEVLP